MRQTRCREFVNFIDFTRTQSNVVPTAVSKQANRLPSYDLWFGAEGAEGSAYLASGASSHRCSCLARDGSLDDGEIVERCAAMRGGSSVDILQRKTWLLLVCSFCGGAFVVMKMHQDDRTTDEGGCVLSVTRAWSLVGDDASSDAYNYLRVLC